MRLFPVIAVLNAAVVILSWTALALAQETGTDNEPESGDPDVAAGANASSPGDVPKELLESRAIDEVTVTAGPQGRTAFEIENDRLAQMREALFAELQLHEREQEELAWRQADPDLQKPESRIKWGYNPQAEQRMRRENDFMYDLPSDQTKPATVFRAEF